MNAMIVLIIINTIIFTCLSVLHFYWAFGGKSFPVKDKKFDAAGIALNAAASMFALDKEKNADQVLQIAEKFHVFLMKNISSTPVEPAK